MNHLLECKKTRGEIVCTCAIVVQKMRDEITRLRAEITRLRAELAKFETHNATYARRWGDAIKERDETRALARRLRAEITRLRAELAKFETHNEELRAEIARLRAEVAEYKDAASNNRVISKVLTDLSYKLLEARALARRLWELLDEHLPYAELGYTERGKITTANPWLEEDSP